MIAIALSVAAAALYCWGAARYRRRFPQRGFSLYRIAAFCTGAIVAAAALSPAFDALADRSFAWHMLQHLTLALIAPPLALLGAPWLLLVASTPPAAARAITRIAHSTAGQALLAPVTGWLCMIFVLWGAHFSPLYEAALERPGIHAIEHLLFGVSALLFWSAVVQVGYSPRPVAFPARMLFLFLALPQGAFVAFAIGASRHPLYPHYARLLGNAAALADQRSGADVMWIAGGLLLFLAFMCEAGAWAYAEREPAAA